MAKKHREFLSKRTDISKYLVHLTKDTENKSAKENLISILKQQTIRANNHHCLFSPKLRKEEISIQKRFNVVCLTETPLEKIHLLTEIPNRRVNLKPYGIVFRKEDLLAYFANPAFYVYEENALLISYLNNQFNDYLDKFINHNEDTSFNKLGALVNIVKEKHDFHWEREWRIRKKLSFNEEEIFAVIAPAKEHKKIRNEIGEEWIEYCLFLDINWNMEEIVEQLSIYMWNEFYQK